MDTGFAHRKRAQYSKTGCTPCKFRKKKCDEHRPTCMACERNVLLCEWPLPRIPASQDSKSKIQQQLYFDGSHLDDGEGGSSELASSDACQESIQRSNLTPPLTITLGDPYLTGVSHAVLRDPESNMLFEYYVNHLAQECSITPAQENPFLTRVLPMALSSDLVLQGLLYFTGAQYPTKSSLTFHAMWTHFAQAVRGLKFGITSFRVSGGKEVGAGALLLAAYFLLSAEIINGKATSGIVSHLKAIQVFLDHLKNTKDIDDETYSFFVEAYAYTAILVEFSVLGYPGAWRLEDASTLLSTSTLGMHIGCASSLFVMIPNITTLGSQLAQERVTWNTNSAIPNGYSFDSTTNYNQLLKNILNWQAPFYITDDALLIFGKIYQQALLLCLQVTFHQHRFMDQELATVAQNIVSNIISLFKMVPPNSPVNTTTCWPLVVTGSCAKTTEDRLFISERLEGMYKRTAFPNLIETRDFLETLWSHYAYFPRISTFMSLTDIQNEMLRQKRSIVFV